MIRYKNRSTVGIIPSAIPFCLLLFGSLWQVALRLFCSNSLCLQYSQLALASTLFAFIVIIIISRILLRKNLVNDDGQPIPPGPLFRYAFLRKYPERALHAWAMKYGPLFSFWLGNQLFVVISDSDIAQNLLVQQGSIFSSRKRYFIKNEIILHDLALTASPYNSTW